jgi:hypothetical protein
MGGLGCGSVAEKHDNAPKTQYCRKRKGKGCPRLSPRDDVEDAVVNDVGAVT